MRGPRHVNVAPEGRGEPRDLDLKRLSRWPAGLLEPADAYSVAVPRPSAGHHAACHDDRRDPTALHTHRPAPRSGYDVAIFGTWTQHALVEARQKAHRSGGLRRPEILEVRGENVPAFAVHLDFTQPIAERAEPGPKLSRADPAARQPVTEVLDRCRPVGAEVGDDHDGRRLIGLRQGCPA